MFLFFFFSFFFFCFCLFFSTGQRRSCVPVMEWVHNGYPPPPAPKKTTLTSDRLSSKTTLFILSLRVFKYFNLDQSPCVCCSSFMSPFAFSYGAVSGWSFKRASAILKQILWRRSEIFPWTPSSTFSRKMSVFNKS